MLSLNIFSKYFMTQTTIFVIHQHAHMKKCPVSLCSSPMWIYQVNAEYEISPSESSKTFSPQSYNVTYSHRCTSYRVARLLAAPLHSEKHLAHQFSLTCGFLGCRCNLKRCAMDTDTVRGCGLSVEVNPVVLKVIK